MKAFNAENDKEFGIERFSMKFGNGNAISVVFGNGAYSDQGETTAEVAAWDSKGDWMLFQNEKWITLEQDHDVMPRCTPGEVAEMIFTLSKL